MKKGTTAILSMLTLLLTSCGGSGQAQTIPEVVQTQSMPIPDDLDLRNVRYCEVIPVFRNRATLNIEVYNTIGLNNCPAELWNQLDHDTLTETYNAVAVKLNGPRYWVINAAFADGATETGKIVDFGGIEMKLVAVLETKLWEDIVGETFYTENEVQRTNTWIYHAGNVVYELTSPEGDVYRMQSYAQTVDPTLTIEDLETLGNRLELPAGWSYQTRVLTENSAIVSEGLAYVINDEFLNTYQKVTP